jgi:hypothetical protein
LLYQKYWDALCEPQNDQPQPAGRIDPCHAHVKEQPAHKLVAAFYARPEVITEQRAVTSNKPKSPLCALAETLGRIDDFVAETCVHFGSPA